MLFSSISFLYYFLPILLIVYFIVPSKYKNIVLLLFSLLFYFYGETKYIIILLLSCIVNYVMALLIDKYRDKDKLLLVLDLLFNIGMLVYFKYSDFVFININSLFGCDIKLLRLALPLGISFFTFQTMSYVIDVYRKDVKANKSLLEFATYVCLFPQLVAGPIVRYKTIEEELKNRVHSFDKFYLGVRRFTIGLAKKVLIANVIGELSTYILSSTNPSIVLYWVGAISFTLQIYYDFSGYSDMAIGLGKMFGFDFLENFNYPLIASSISGFWRRWHISLSSWLRDYVYIPMGGNRVSKSKLIRNIVVVWFITGLWHGANWNFIIWGMYFCVLLLIEKFFIGNFLKKHKVFSYMYTIFFIIISFVIFNIDSMNDLGLYLKGMFGLNGLTLLNTEAIYYIRSYTVILIIGAIGATPLLKTLANKYNKYLGYIEPLFYIGILVIVSAFLIDSSFNPFLYFRF